MGLFKDIFRFCTAAAVAVGCSGTVDESTLPVLTASDTEIDLATETSTEFTVTYNGRDVTAESKFFSSSSVKPQDGPVFTPETEGTYTFHAEYEGKQSNTVTVTVVNTKQTETGKYEKHVSIIEFTGAWCNFCPAGYDRMMMMINAPSMSGYKDRIHISAFHSSSSGADAMAIPATEDVFNLFRKSGIEFPSFVCDLKYAGNLAQEVISYFKESLTAALKEDTAHCGVAVSSSVNDSKASVTVKVDSEKTSEYRVLLLVVEDKVLAPETPQKSPLYQNGDPDHVHKHVVRQVVTSYAGTFTGEKITDDGKIKAGQEVSKSWNFHVDDKWNLANTEIYALVLNADGNVDNMNVCPIMNGNSDYNLRK